MIRLPKHDGNFEYYRNVIACTDRRCQHPIRDETVANNKSTGEDEEGMSDKYSKQHTNLRATQEIEHNHDQAARERSLG